MRAMPARVRPQETLSHRDLVARMLALRSAHVAAARRASAPFVSYVLRDEAGRPLKLAPFHLEWHALWRACKNVIIWGSAEIGKSVQILGYLAWRIGIDPGVRIALTSKTRDKAAQLLGMLVKIMTSAEYREVFPNVVILGANAHTIRVLGYDGRNPTVQAFQFRAPIVGNRVDVLVFDDILDRSNTRTEELRNEYFAFYKDTYISRLTREGQVIFVSNAWHPRDLMHRLQAEGTFVTKRYPIWSEVDGQMVSLWPAQWPIQRIRERKAQYGKDVVLWQRNYECVALDDASQTWKREWIDVAERAGFGLPWVTRLADAHGEQFRLVSIGVDLATKRPGGRKKTDESVVAVTGRRAHDGRKRLLHLRAGRWYGPGIVSQIRDVRDRFYPGGVIVETNAAQMYIADFCREGGAPQGPNPRTQGWFGMPIEEEPPPPADPIPVQSFETTAQNKYDARFGVEALGTEMANGIWLFPRQVGAEPPVEYVKLVDEMMSYDPHGHTGDRLMALWISSEGLRLSAGSGGQSVAGANGLG